MATLQVGPADYSGTRQKAIEDARKMQVSIVKECTDSGKETPPYVLSELIGKGSFGRVYKATGDKPGQLVSVKIISIEEGDSLDPRADTFSDILKEINALKLLSNSGAKNINTIIDALLVGQSMWMGIIHRDIKCANVLITEAGGVQLCDFGVAGIIKNKFDKRSTVTGSIHWMAPELFDSQVSYGKEVDIWAFGSMAYEIASGLPPNAHPIVDIPQFGSYLKQHCPRLEGDQFSPQLKDVVAYCMVEDPAQRPPIEQIQRHPYIINTANDYPTVLLSKLVNAYKLWEIQGGNRRSLFSTGGAQGPLGGHFSPSDTNEWDFSTSKKDDSDQLALGDPDAQAVYNVYGPRVDFPQSSGLRPRRRQPPNIKAFTAPLEKVFDPNTISNYEENARVFYSRLAPLPSSNLPLRDNSEHLAIRESLIDLDASLHGIGLSNFADLETIKAGARPLSSNAGDLNHRRTQDWSFPMMVSTSISPDMPRFQPNDDQTSIRFNGHPTQGWSFPMMASDSSSVDGSRLQSKDDQTYHTSISYTTQLTQVHRPSDLATDQSAGQVALSAQLNRASVLSLIDLDASLPGDMADVARPSTADSDTTSISSDMATTPFDLEWPMFQTRFLPSTNREPSIYVSDDRGSIREPSIYIADAGYTNSPSDTQRSDLRGTLHIRGADPRIPRMASEMKTGSAGKPMLPLPPRPVPPSADVMEGISSREELKEELQHMISGLGEHLQFTNDMLGSLPVRRAEHEPAE